MGKTEEDLYGLKLGFLKTVQPNSFSKLISAVCNFKNTDQETYLFVSNLWFCHSITCTFFAYIKFHSDCGRAISKIKQNEQDCHDTAPLSSLLFSLRREAFQARIYTGFHRLTESVRFSYNKYYTFLIQKSCPS